jgi:hypothetical protein
LSKSAKNTVAKNRIAAITSLILLPFFMIFLFLSMANIADKLPKKQSKIVANVANEMS